LGLNGSGAQAMLSKPSRIDGSGSWFSADQSASLGFVLPATANEAGYPALALGVHLFASQADTRIHVSVNGEAKAVSMSRGSGACVHVVELNNAAQGEVYVLDIAVRNSRGQPLPFRLDGIQAAALSDLSHHPEVRPFFGYRVERDGDREFAWMPREVDLNLPPEWAGKKLRVEGYVPFGMHRQQNGISVFKLDAVVNGKPRKTVQMSADGPFDIVLELDPSRTGSDRTISVNLRSSSNFTPANEDRELSFIISKIEAS
jgi:hypothetical protein